MPSIKYANSFLRMKTLPDISIYQKVLMQWKKVCVHLRCQLDTLRSKKCRYFLSIIISPSLRGNGELRLRSLIYLSSSRIGWLTLCLTSTSLGKHLNDEQLRIAAALRLGAPPPFPLNTPVFVVVPWLMLTGVMLSVAQGAPAVIYTTSWWTMPSTVR